MFVGVKGVGVGVLMGGIGVAVAVGEFAKLKFVDAAGVNPEVVVDTGGVVVAGVFVTGVVWSLVVWLSQLW